MRRKNVRPIFKWAGTLFDWKFSILLKTSMVPAKYDNSEIKRFFFFPLKAFSWKWLIQMDYVTGSSNPEYVCDFVSYK